MQRLLKRLFQKLIRGHNIEALEEEVSLEINQRSQYRGFLKRLVQRLIRGHNIEALEEFGFEINQRSQYKGS